MIAHIAAGWLAAPGLAETGRDARFLARSLALALPGLGLAGLTVIRLWRRRAPAGLYTGAHAVMADLPGPSQSPEPVDRVFDWLQAQVSVQPVADLLRAGDPRTQRWGIELLAKRGDGPSVDLIREALHAEDRDTQIVASAALQRVDERLAGRIGQAQEQLRLDPDSPARRMALGDACVAYRESHLLDAVMGRHWLEQAEAAYRSALAARPGWPEAARALARVLLALGHVTPAESVAREARGAAPSPEMDLLLAEILYVQHRWGDLGALAREAVRAGAADETLRWWGGEGA
ncbi:MAG TPA: tetratricopeptide repeat protein [Candidatus Dormibacteraeota bacterium]|nr:tetratricopeptide repeat protein [Candidatus Dormibacteraeota bacterium]